MKRILPYLLCLSLLLMVFTATFTAYADEAEDRDVEVISDVIEDLSAEDEVEIEDEDVPLATFRYEQVPLAAFPNTGGADSPTYYPLFIGGFLFFVLAGILIGCKRSKTRR